MVNLKRKEKRMCEGRLIVTDFKKLNPADFEPVYHFKSKAELREEVALLSIKGIIYINNRSDTSDFMAKIFEFLMKESTKSLKKYQRELKSAHPAVKSFEDWAKIAKREGCGSKESIECLIKLLIPTERQRRRAELNYFSQTRVSQGDNI